MSALNCLLDASFIFPLSVLFGAGPMSSWSMLSVPRICSIGLLNLGDSVNKRPLGCQEKDQASRA
jgi:hypothetical protein